MWGSLYVHRLVLILNIFLLFSLSSLFSKKHKMPSLLTKSSFWIYSTHYPLTLLVGSIHPEFGDREQVVFYMVSVIAITLFCLALYWLGHRLSPKVMNILTGNR